MPTYEPSFPAAIRDDLLRGYVAAMLWCNTMRETDDSLESAEPEHTEDAGVTAAALQQAREDCRGFRTLAEACPEWAPYVADEEYAGHCFALSRNGHGAGFFDSRYGDHRELHRIAKTYGPRTWCLDAHGNADCLE